MKVARYATACGGVIVVLLLFGMQSHPSPDVSLLGPEVSGLRIGLHIAARNTNGKDTYDVRVSIRNTSPRPITLIGPAPYEGELNGYAEWLKAEVSFTTFPELIPPSAQTGGTERTSPNPQTTIAPGKDFTVSWSSKGRYLKSEDFYNTTPCFPSDGLYGVRARIMLTTSQGKQIPLYSNEQPVSVGGSVALPKHGVAYVLRRDEESQHVTLSLGVHHRIVEGDRFRVAHRFPSGWMLTVTRVNPMSSRATVEAIGPHKDDMAPLPPENAKAQLWDFGRESPTAESSREEAKSIHIGMTRRELEKLCHVDGGITSLLGPERYVLNDRPPDGPQGKVLKVNVGFKPADVSEQVYQDPKKFKAWLREQRGAGRYSDDDVVVSVSPPYWEPQYCD